MESNCGVTFTSLIDYVESGGIPIPIIFGFQNCEGASFPNFFDSDIPIPNTITTLRKDNAACNCKLSQIGDPSTKGATDCNNKTCPLKRIGSMFIPRQITDMEFSAYESAKNMHTVLSAGSPTMGTLGYAKIPRSTLVGVGGFGSKIGTQVFVWSLPPNLLPKGTDPDEFYANKKWKGTPGTITSDSELVKPSVCNYDPSQLAIRPSKDHFNRGPDSPSGGEYTYVSDPFVFSILNCGMNFTMQFGSFHPDTDIYHGNDYYWVGTPKRTDHDSCINNCDAGRQQYCGYAGGETISKVSACSNDNYAQKDHYSPCDCITLESPNHTRYCRQTGCEQQGYGLANCGCDPWNQVRGTVNEIKYIGASWEDELFTICTQSKLYEIMGTPIKRYEKGGPACDQFMSSYCSDTANLEKTGVYSQCSCILEQKRLDIQFGNLAINTQCLSTMCAGSSPNVYKTGQMIQGCSTKLCQQIINIHGSEILAKGIQSMTCNGHVTKVNDSTHPSASADSKPDASSPKISDKFELGAVFWVSLGVLGILLILIIVWGIRRFLTMRMIKKSQHMQVQSILMNKLT
jgi:hypothetical protein